MSRSMITLIGGGNPQGKSERTPRAILGLEAQDSLTPLVRGFMRLGLGKRWLRFAFGGLCALLLTTGCGHSSRTIQIKALIDGADTVKIQGNKLWFEHGSFDLPGKWQNRDEPTFINGRPWRPEWHGKTSAPFENLEPPFKPQSPAKIKLTKLIGRGVVKITRLPDTENDQTLAVRFDDESFGGADWYEVKIYWE